MMTREEQAKEITKKIEAKLKESNIKYEHIFTVYEEDGLMMDAKGIKPMYSTVITEPVFGKLHAVQSDAETLELLYVQVNYNKLVTIERYFRKREL